MGVFDQFTQLPCGMGRLPELSWLSLASCEQPAAGPGPVARGPWL